MKKKQNVKKFSFLLLVTAQKFLYQKNYIDICHVTWSIEKCRKKPNIMWNWLVNTSSWFLFIYVLRHELDISQERSNERWRRTQKLSTLNTLNALKNVAQVQGKASHFKKVPFFLQPHVMKGTFFIPCCLIDSWCMKI